MRAAPLVAIATIGAACGAPVGTGAQAPHVVETSPAVARPSAPTGLASPRSTPTRTAAPLPTDLELAIEPVMEALGVPLTAATAPPGDDRIFVATQGGRILVIEGGATAAEPFLDLRREVKGGGEQGLLDIAFHPRYGDNGRFLVHYTAEPEGETRIVEYQVSATDPGRADPSTAETILALEQPHRWHNGGELAFGPQGYLWIGLGEGTAEQTGAPQDPFDLHGKVLRIDVDVDSGGYLIPSDNPFARGEAGAPEVWALGLRNPWRLHVDPVERLVYIGDVGQYHAEEINIHAIDEGGANFGWPVLEGHRCYRSDDCDPSGMVAPTLVYPHDNDACAVIAGTVYRGDVIPELWGHFLYADLCGGWVRSLLHDDGAATDEHDWTGVFERLPAPTSFGTDGDGEVLITSGTGALYRLVSAG